MKQGASIDPDIEGCLASEHYHIRDTADFRKIHCNGLATVSVDGKCKEPDVERAASEVFCLKSKAVKALHCLLMANYETRRTSGDDDSLGCRSYLSKQVRLL